MAKVKIKIDPKGNPTIMDICGAGTNCLEATKNFEKMLGSVQEESRQLTEHYFEADEQILVEEQELEGNG